MLKFLKFLSLSSIFLFICFQLTAQVPPTDLAQAKSLKAKFPDDKFYHLGLKTDYVFKQNKKNDEPIVESEDEIQTIALVDNEKCNLNWQYDDNSAITGEKFSNKKGKKIFYKKVCGNFENEGIFYSDAKACLYQIEDIAQGEIFNSNVSQRYIDVRYFTKVFFHENYPVGAREINFTIPEGVQIDLVEINFDGYKIEKSKKINSSTKATEIKYVINSISSLDKEENTLGPAHIYPHLLVITKSYLSDGKPKNIFSSLDDLYEWYSTLAGKTSNDHVSLSALVKQLISNSKTEVEKVKNIFYWVQDNIRYIAFEDGIAGFKPEDAQSVYQKKYGDCKGMANLTKAMLQIAGLDARLTWIGTSRLPYTFDTPCLGINNHMICTWIFKGKNYFLDPTEKFVAFGNYAARIQDKQVLIENGKKYALDKVPVSTYESNLIEYKENLKLDGQKLIGKANLKVNGESKVKFLRLYDFLRNDRKSMALNNVLTGRDKNVEVENIKTSDLQNREAELTIDYDISISNKVNSFGNDLYIDADLQKQYQTLIFEDSRLNDYSFHKSVYEKKQVVVAIPDGYKLNHLPSNMNFKHADFTIDINFQHINNTIVYDKKIIINNGIIKKSQFKTWNSAIKELNKIYEDQIILSH